MRAIGKHVVLKPAVTSFSGGLTLKGDGEAYVQSCPSMPELEGKKILFNDKTKYAEYEEFYITTFECILAVLDEEELE